MSTLSRRDFLKLSGSALAAMAFRPDPPEQPERRALGLGRAIKFQDVYDRPSTAGRRVRSVVRDGVFKYYGREMSDDDYHNKVWYRLPDGYIHSSWVQPVRNEPQPATLDIPKSGFLAEVSVPFTDAWAERDGRLQKVYRLYYSTTYWAVAAHADEQARVWYRLLDDRLHIYYWALGTHLRRVQASELTPLSPEAGHKRIEIDLANQTFTAYEDGRAVMKTLCSTGIWFESQQGTVNYGTPPGEWAINRKRPTRHMAGDDAASADFFDLPGVPWVSYFHWWGLSIHGTYWHNDYGRPRSHGCVNLTPEDARWVYRWSLPRADRFEQQIDGEGTQVIVF